jgi:hypothetical protein
MTPIRLVLGAGLILAFASPAALAAGAPKTPPAAAATAPVVEPEAVQALARMSAYLRTLTSFQITAETSTDLVMYDGQILKLDGVNEYTVRRPDGFVVEVATPYKVRRLIYDGKQMTIYAPELGYYATVEAPGTSREAVEAARERYGLQIPLMDLFRWADPSQPDSAPLVEAMLVGPAKVGGVEAEQFAFREEGVDWQIWIQKGDHPVPLKVVIVDRLNPDRPQYEARLRWNLAPSITASTFAFKPAKDEMLIRMSTLKTK